MDDLPSLRFGHPPGRRHGAAPRAQLPENAGVALALDLRAMPVRGPRTKTCGRGTIAAPALAMAFGAALVREPLAVGDGLRRRRQRIGREDTFWRARPIRLRPRSGGGKSGDQPQHQHRGANATGRHISETAQPYQLINRTGPEPVPVFCNDLSTAEEESNVPVRLSVLPPSGRISCAIIDPGLIVTTAPLSNSRVWPTR
jgi:hypothetical protein